MGGEEVEKMTTMANGRRVHQLAGHRKTWAGFTIWFSRTTVVQTMPPVAGEHGTH